MVLPGEPPEGRLPRFMVLLWPGPSHACQKQVQVINTNLIC